MNISNETQVLNPGKNIATFSPVTEVKNIIKETERPTSHIPKHFEDLYERIVQGMNTEQ